MVINKPKRCVICDKRISNKNNYCYGCQQTEETEVIDDTHLFGGIDSTGEAVCSPDCWCKEGEE